MGLDIYLRGEFTTVKCTCLECGNVHTKEIQEVFYSSSITHNLRKAVYR